MRCVKLIPIFFLFLLFLLPIAVAQVNSDQHGLADCCPSWLTDDTKLGTINYAFISNNFGKARSCYFSYRENPGNASNDYSIDTFNFYVVSSRGTDANSHLLVARRLRLGLNLAVNDSSSGDRVVVGPADTCVKVQNLDVTDFPIVANPAVYRITWNNVNFDVVKSSATDLCFELFWYANTPTYNGYPAYALYHKTIPKFSWDDAVDFTHHIRFYNEYGDVQSYGDADGLGAPLAWWTWTNITGSYNEVVDWRIKVNHPKSTYNVGDTITGYIENNGNVHGAWAVQHGSEEGEIHGNGYIVYGAIRAESRIEFGFTINQPGSFYINVSKFSDGNIVINSNPWQLGSADSTVITAVNDTSVSWKVTTDKSSYELYSTVHFWTKAPYGSTSLISVIDLYSNIEVYNGTYFNTNDGTLIKYDGEWYIDEKRDMLWPFKVILYDVNWDVKAITTVYVVPRCGENLHIDKEYFELGENIRVDVCHNFAVTDQVVVEVGKYFGGLMFPVRYFNVPQNNYEINFKLSTEDAIGNYWMVMVVNNERRNDTLLTFAIGTEDQVVEYYDDNSFGYLVGAGICLGFGGAFGYLVGPVTMPFVAGTLAILLSRPEMGTFHLLPEAISVYMIALMLMIGLFLWLL